MVSSWKNYLTMSTTNDEKIIAIEQELVAHEVQCEERWKTTFNRLQQIEQTLKGLESRLIMGAGSLILFLAGVIVMLLRNQA